MRKITITGLSALTALNLVTLTTPVIAATQGTLGATSTGSASISVTKSVQAQISDLSDMTLSSWNIGGGAVTLYSNVCVYSSTGSYYVTASGSGASSAFTIASTSHTIPYSVTWNAGGAGSIGNTGTALTAAVQAATPFANAATASANCSGGGASNDTARVVVGITSTDMTAATASSTPYTGTLTMLITPY